ncbi:MAG: hypothetical protein LBE56_08105 [Tannerella sp.]|nr:hypothetical protein [Tannerella sp.]
MEKQGIKNQKKKGGLTFQCEVCNKTFSHKSSLKRREKKCLFNSGMEKFNSGKFVDAIEVLSKFLELSPIYFWAYIVRGDAKCKTKHYIEALDDYNKAIEVCKFRELIPIAYTLCGDTEIELEDYYNAIDDYNKAIELNPHFIEGYDCCIAAYELINDYDSARKIQERKTIAEQEFEKMLLCLDNNKSENENNK